MQQWKRAQEQKVAQVIFKKIPKVAAQSQTGQNKKTVQRKKIVLTKKPVYNSAFTSYANQRRRR